MSEFTTEPGFALRARFDEHEAGVIRNLLIEMESMLDTGRLDDPVMERLFPRAYTTESDEESYRELIGTELERGKKEALVRLRDSLGSTGPVDIPLSQQEADDWLVALNDIRLAVGTRLEVTEETMTQELDPDDRRAPALALLHWLGWVQESIIEKISPEEENG